MDDSNQPTINLDALRAEDEIQKVVDEIKASDDFFQKAKLVQYLQKEKKITTKKLSDFLEIQPAYLCHIARLNKLPDIVIDGYYSGGISISHLFIIARLKETEQMVMVYEKVLAQSLTVLQTEELVREYLYHLKAEGEHLSKKELEVARDKIAEKYKNLEVKIIQTRVKAKLILEIKGNLKKTSQALNEVMEALSK